MQKFVLFLIFVLFSLHTALVNCECMNDRGPFETFCYKEIERNGNCDNFLNTSGIYHDHENYYLSINDDDPYSILDLNSIKNSCEISLLNECIIEITSCAALPYPESMITAASIQIRPRMNESMADACKINNQTEFTIQFYLLDKTYTCEYNNTVNEAMPCNAVPITICKTPSKEVVTSQTDSYIHATTNGNTPFEIKIGSINVTAVDTASNNAFENCTNIQECYNETATSMTFTNFTSSNSVVSTAAATILMNSTENCTNDPACLNETSRSLQLTNGTVNYYFISTAFTTSNNSSENCSNDQECYNATAISLPIVNATISSFDFITAVTTLNRSSRNCTSDQPCYNGTSTNLQIQNVTKSYFDSSTGVTTLNNSTENCTIDCNSETTETTAIYEKMMPQSATTNIQSSFGIVITSAAIVSPTSTSAYTTYIVIIVALSICLIGLLIFITVYYFRNRKKYNQNVHFQSVDIGLNEISSSISSNYSKA